MLTICLAGVNIGIDNQYDLAPRLQGWLTEAAPVFTVRVSPEELLREDDGSGKPPDYLEYICVYRKLAERLPDYDAFVFHGAAIAMDGRAYLFTAPSGTGKTSHGQIWRYLWADRAYFLNGDKPILRRGPEGFLACGTPWRGKEGFGVNETLPIQGICLLHRGTENRIERAAPEELIRFLTRQIYIPRDPDRAERLLQLLDACCRTVPAWSMRCTLNLDAARISYAAMRPRD